MIRSTRQALRYARWRLGVALSLCVYVAACVALHVPAPEQRTERGLIFAHEVHAQAGLECAACHDLGVRDPIALNHQLCGVCHSIDETNPEPAACAVCHSRADYSVDPRPGLQSDEVIFSHVPHLDAGIACSQCHAEPDSRAYRRVPSMAACMDCHADVDAALNACGVCHSELDVDVVPKFRAGTRILHDAPETWAHLHGREYRVDPKYCANCHQQEAFCAECHRKNEPADHTVSWKRRYHGLQAGWDRRRCSVCHEEDACLKCHQRTRPTSHHGAFMPPRNTHCVECHFPPDTASCTVCHEHIDHHGAGLSPHILGIYPANCGACHPGGLPHLAPHLNNGTTRCVYCHN